ncbi:MAG: SsrA-binding protein SmpB [Hyphomicrobiales bacterium]
MSSKHGGAKKARQEPGRQVVADNRKARFNFEIIDVFEAGLQLAGTEVKSLRGGKASLLESYAAVENGEVWLINANIPVYEGGNRNNHEPKRPRKLLLHGNEIRRLTGAVQRDGLTLIPLKLYFNARGLAKLEIALAKGKKLHDKRQTERDRSWQRDKARLLRERG